MKYILYIIIIISINLPSLIFSQTVIPDRTKLAVPINDNAIFLNKAFYDGKPVQFTKNITYGPYHVIGPEIPVLSGFYDWQTNGNCKHNIAWMNNIIVHAMYMTSSDSSDIITSRRTKYAFSYNDGSTWSDLGIVPQIRSGFPSMTTGKSGDLQDAAIIANHYQPGSMLTSCVNVDLIAGIGSFTTTQWNYNISNFCWPQTATLSNGNILVGAETYDVTGTDTGVAVVFNPYTHTWINSTQKFFVTPTNQSSMSWTVAAGPNGKCLYVLVAVNDDGSSLGKNRIFYWTSTNNGVTWSNINTLFESFVDATGDTVTAWIGLDAVYDNAGNFYVVYNTIADSLQTAKIWVSKNGEPGVLAASNRQIEGSLKWFNFEQAFACSMDWPTISVTDNNNFVYIGYAVAKQNDMVNAFQSFDVYFSYAPANSMVFRTPQQITTGISDERYISFNRKIIAEYPMYHRIHLSYQKDAQPGSAAQIDNAPLSRATLVYRYVVCNVDTLITGSGNAGTGVPSEFNLEQNYPNPFNPSTNIRYDIPAASYIVLRIYDMLGKAVETLVNSFQQPGKYEVTWDAEKFSSGIYILKITAGDFQKTKKMILLK